MIGIPLWVNKPEAGSGKVAFVGKGTDANIFDARLEAKTDILDKISAYVGSDVQPLFYREFSTTDKITELDLTVTHEYSQGNTLFLMVECDATLLANHRTEVQDAIEKNDRKIKELLAQSDIAYRENKDVNAISFCLESVAIAAGGPSSYSVDTLLKKSINYIGSLKFLLVKEEPAKAIVQVRLVRSRFLFSPKVKDAEIRASFLSTNSQGRQGEDTLLFSTSDNGSFTFVPYNSGILKLGTVTFLIDVQAFLQTLKPLLTEQQYQQLQQAVEENSAIFNYDMVSEYEGKEMLVNIKEYSIDGKLLKEHFPLLEVSAFLNTHKIKPVVDYSETKDGADLAQELAGLYPGQQYLLSGTVGVVSNEKVGPDNLVIISGQMQIWDLFKQKKLGDTSEIKVVAPTEDDALVEFGRIAISLLNQFI